MGANGLRANEGTIAGFSAAPASLLCGGLRGGGTGADAGGGASGGFGIGFCAGADWGDAEGGAVRVACAAGCGAVAAAGTGVVTDAVFGEVDVGVGVEGATCAGLSTLDACVFGACAMGLCAGGMGADGVLVVAAARDSVCMLGVCTGAATRVVWLTAGFMGAAAGGIGVCGRADIAACGALIGGAACGNADVGRGASFTGGAVGAGATARAGGGGIRGGVIVGGSTAEALRSLVSTRTAGVDASFAMLGVACTTDGETCGDGLDVGAVAGIVGVGCCAGFATVAADSTVASGNGSVFRTARTRGVTSAVEAVGFVDARLGLASASSVATGFAAARLTGGFGGAGILPGVGTAASAVGDFRLRGVFGRSVSSMRQV